MAYEPVTPPQRSSPTGLSTQSTTPGRKVPSYAAIRNLLQGGYKSRPVETELADAAATSAIHEAPISQTSSIPVNRESVSDQPTREESFDGDGNPSYADEQIALEEVNPQRTTAVVDSSNDSSSPEQCSFKRRCHMSNRSESPIDIPPPAINVQPEVPDDLADGTLLLGSHHFNAVYEQIPLALDVALASLSRLSDFIMYCMIVKSFSYCSCLPRYCALI